MEFAKQEIQAIELITDQINEAVLELTELELAIIGGGTGAVSLG